MTDQLLAPPALSSRLLAGAGLAAMAMFWLVAWLPLALTCLMVGLVGGLRPSHRTPL